MEDGDEPLDNVVELPPRDPDAEIEPPIRRVRSRNACYHKKVIMDADARTLACKDCGSMVDWVDWLDTLVREWERYVYHWRDTRRKIREADARLAELLRLERNARARLGRLNRDSQ